MMEKVLLVIIDGLADRPSRVFDGRTPLDVASTPNLDALARTGMTGLMHTVNIGVRPGSDVAHLSIFGYDPNEYYEGRGPFEAAGVTFKIQKGDIAFRANFATVNTELVIINRRAGRIDDTEPLIEQIDGIEIEGTTFYVKKGTGHRAAVVMRGKNLSGQLSNSDPKTEGVKVLTVKSLDRTKNSIRTARIVNIFIKKTHEILSKHPMNKERENKGLPTANILLLRGAGKMGEFPSFKKRYGLTAACIAGAGMYKGLARILGMKIVEVPGATGKPDTDVEAKIKSAMQAFLKYDFVYLHIKAADSLSEDGDVQAKKAFIEKTDKAFEPLLNLKKTLVVITADHTTSSAMKRHTADPVPILMTGTDISRDDIDKFDERSVSRGKLGHIRGRHLMPIILDQIGLLAIFGA